MSYRNKTYVAFASEDIRSYRLMQAWHSSDNIDFDFYDAHALYVSRDTSLPETIRRNLRQRMSNAKQIVLLGSPVGRRKGSDATSFLAHEVKIAREFDLPIVIANLNGSRTVDETVIPQPLLDSGHYTVSVSFQPRIIMHALDKYVPVYLDAPKRVSPVGWWTFGEAA